MTYCRECGKLKVSETLNTFDELTGERATRKVCPYECEHGRHYFQAPPPDHRTFRQRVFGLPNPDCVCVRCGKRLWFSLW